MTTDTVLTDFQIFDCFDRQCSEMVINFDAEELYPVGRVIEQAVLQSGQVQAWKKDAQQWQPIETAPKDGTEILLFRDADVFDGKPVPPRVTLGSWTEWQDTASEFHSTTGEYLGESIQDSGAYWASWDGGFSEDAPPTHWMPLPDPPTASRSGQS